MMTLLNPLSRLDESAQTFTHEVSSAYCHPGLEEIYTLETIDPRTIRRIQTAPPEEAQHTLATTHSPLDQLELPLGDEFVSTTESFVLNEPLHVLKLATTIEQRLKEKNIVRLRDLVNADWAQLVFTKGIGQGHIDEIRERLHHYLEGKALYVTQNIDFEAWIRSLLPDNICKQAAILLDAYDLPSLVATTPAEQAEIRRLTPERRQQWLDEALVAFRHNQHLFSASIQKVLNTFVKPWMRARHGIAFEYELIDRLHQVAEDQRIVSSALNFFTNVFSGGKPLFPQYIVEVSPMIYCADTTIADCYRKVKKAAKSYFYKNTVHYQLQELSTYIEKEWAREWGSVDTAFIVKVLRSSPAFRVRKGSCGNLLVTLR